MRSVIRIGLLGALLALGSCQASDVDERRADLETLAAWMSGSFSSHEQSTAQKEYFDIRLHHARIWSERQDGVWLYVEQARADVLDKPYRQRVYHLHATDEDITSDVFTLPGDQTTVAARFAGAWNKPELLAGVTPDSLTPREGCSIHLERASAREFRGSTVGNLCPSDRQGATYATSEVVVQESLLTSWDQGFDASGKQVWGAVKGPYRFVKVP